MSMPTCPTCKYAKGVCGKTGVPIRHSTGCTYHEPKPQTNADRIRAMTDEELAELFETLCPSYKWTFALRGMTWFGFLKQEVESNDS